MRIIPRSVEGYLGRKLFKLASDKALKDARLVRKSVILPKSKVTIHYLERCPKLPTTETSKTLLFCHGMADEGKNFAPFIHALQIPDNVRIVVPDTIGHGKDLERAMVDPTFFQFPTQEEILESTIEFVEEIVYNTKNQQSSPPPPCHAFGYSMGGALVYFLRLKRPDLIQNTVLIAPSIEHVIDDDFIDDFLSGKKRHFCFETREEVKLLFRDLCVPHRIKKDPIPKFFLQAILEERELTAPPQHFDKLLQTLLDQRGKDPEMSTAVDLEPSNNKNGNHARRLVIWPDHDYICNYHKGKAFFQESPATTIFHTVPNCGHMFDKDGVFLLDICRAMIRKFLLENDQTKNTDNGSDMRRLRTAATEKSSSDLSFEC